MTDNNKEYDVVVIGAGPAGYVCAIRCSQLGMKVACIDQWVNTKGKPSLGGTCLNVGCIPSKALLDSSHHVHFLKEQAKEHGIKVGRLEVDVATMQKRKDKIVQVLTGGVASLLKKNKVDVFSAVASFASPKSIKVQNAGTQLSETLQAKHVVIASGSVPIDIPIAKVDNKTVLDSTGALDLQDVPKRLGIIGAGVIGLEMGSVWKRLGSEVVILEAMKEFLPTADQAISKEAYKILTKQGLDIRMNSLVNAVTVDNGKALVKYESNGEQKSLEIDKLIVAVGRKANIDGLDLDVAKIKTNQKGFIETNQNWQTSAENVYAIGDVIGGAMLAHIGSEEGIAVAELLAGQHAKMNHDHIPWVIYTWPEIAWAGKTQQDCKDEGIQYRVGTFPFMALGRARAMGDTEGVFKIIADKNTDQIIGVHILGPNASELISEAVVAMESDLSAEDLARTIHAHPSLAEGMHEAALAVDERAIHI
ncbi:MAG: dihydrolipoyl dehydrogenase [Gammaproteobacteria bacterium]